jgi:AcrR family transcriptional regulator
VVVVAGVKGQVQTRGTERRAAIIDAAVELFSRSGYQGTALTEIAERVGVSAPAILHHFGSKAGLLVAVLAEVDRRHLDSGAEVFGPGGLETLRRLRRFAESMDGAPEVSAIHLLLEAEHLHDDGPVGAYLRRRARAMRAMVAAALTTGQETGEIRADVDPVAKAAEIVAYLDGAARTWLVDPRLSILDLYDSYLDAVLVALSVESPSSAQ